MVKSARGSGSGSKKTLSKKKAPVKKAVEKKVPPVKKALAKKKSTKKEEGSSDPPVLVQTDPISAIICKEIVLFNPPEFVVRLEEVLNHSSRQEEHVEKDEGVPASGSATPGLDLPRALSEESHSLYADVISSSLHFEGNTPRSGQSAFPSSVNVAVGIDVEEAVVPGVPTPGSEPVVPPSGSAQAVPTPSFARGPHFTDRFQCLEGLLVELHLPQPLKRKVKRRSKLLMLSLKMKCGIQKMMLMLMLV